MKSDGRGSLILRNRFLGVEYRPWESLWPGSPKPEFPLLLLLLSLLRQAGTWTKVSSSIKRQRHYRRRKSAARMHSWDKLWATRYKKIKAQLPLLRCWEQKQVLSISQHTAPPRGWADHLSHPSCLTHRSAPTLTPHKGPACPPQDRVREFVSLPSNCSKNSNETGQDPMVLAPPCPHPAFCLWKSFSHTLSLIREVRKWRN